MPSSWSPSLRFELQFTGENLNLWGEKLSDTLARVDDAIAGHVEVAVTGDHSLASSNDNRFPDQARMAHLKFTGTLTLNAAITLPSVSKSYWVWNATDKTLTFTTGAGATVTVEAGDKAPIWCDGANVNTLAFGPYALKDYIGAISASAGAVPGVTGHAGKFLFTDGSAAYWKQAQTTDLADYLTEIIGKQVALAVAL